MSATAPAALSSAPIVSTPGRETANAREREGGGNPATVLLAALLLAAFTALYRLDPTLYLHVLRAWTPEAMPSPFADTLYVQNQLACWRAGIDVYTANPCDVFGRGNAYPPFWLRLWFLPADTAWTAPLALTMVLGFFASLLLLPPVRGMANTGAWLAAVMSPAVAYGVERGNADLLVFVLAAFALVAGERSLAWRIAGYAAVTLAALLKLYPLILTIRAAGERPRAAAATGFVLALVLGGLAWVWRAEWLAMLPNIPGPAYSTDGPGGRKLGEGLFILAGWAAGAPLDTLIPRRAAVAALFGLLLLASVLPALRLARQPRLATALACLTTRERGALILGGLLFSGCFMAAATSIAYREVVLLFALPALLRFGSDRHLWFPVRWSAWIVPALMWGGLPALYLDIHFGPMDENGGPWPTFAFWLAREILWWWLFTVLTASLLCLASLSGRLNIHARPA